MDGATALLGGLAGLATSFLWAASATIWGVVTRRVQVSSISLAAMRVLMAAVVLVAIHRVFYGEWLPESIRPETAALLVFSSFMSVTLGDIGFFYGIRYIGPRLVMLLTSLAPIATTLIAWLAIGEALGWRDLVGIAAVVGGVSWVVAEKSGGASWSGEPGKFGLGVVLALAGTLLLAASYVVSRLAMTGGRITEGPSFGAVDPYSATVIRIGGAAVLTWLMLPAFGATRDTVRAYLNPKLLPLAITGTIVGLVLGVWTSLLTLKYAPSGVGAALMSLSPIFMIPFSAIVFREKHSSRAVIGTVLAVAGAVLLIF